MSKSEVKVREFWIDPTDDAGEEDLFFGDVLKEHPRQGPLQWQESLIHVIEYSYAKKLEEHNKQLRKDIWKLVEENKRLREALVHARAMFMSLSTVYESNHLMLNPKHAKQMCDDHSDIIYKALSGETKEGV